MERCVLKVLSVKVLFSDFRGTYSSLTIYKNYFLPMPKSRFSNLFVDDKDLLHT